VPICEAVVVRQGRDAARKLTDPGDDHDMAKLLLSHMRQGCFYDVERPKIVDFELLSNEIQGLLGRSKFLYRPDKRWGILEMFTTKTGVIHWLVQQSRISIFPNAAMASAMAD
jgi:hypothetical protein